MVLTMQKRKLVSGSENYNTQMLYFTCSSLSLDDQRIYLISDRDGNPNIFVCNTETGEAKQLTHNMKGYLKSYVFFDGGYYEGLGKSSVCLDSAHDIVYYIQDDKICKTTIDGTTTILNTVPEDRMTAFTHVSADGKKLCVPMTDGRCLDFDPETEGTGLDKRPVYDIDKRVQDEKLNSYLYVYDTQTGELLFVETVPNCWITHVQFNPVNSDQILYNHEWSHKDCGIRRMWLFDGEKHVRIRTEAPDRSRNDWVCHEMWSDDGKTIIYHGGFDDGPAFVGRYSLETKECIEIPLPENYTSYGHFTMSHTGRLVCDGYFKPENEEEKVMAYNSTDFGADPHKKDGKYITLQDVDWEARTIKWTLLCRHGSDWLGQDAHPHPIYSHKGDKIFFSSRENGHVKVYCVETL